jgi:hypothetical protein
MVMMTMMAAPIMPLKILGQTTAKMAKAKARAMKKA